MEQPSGIPRPSSGIPRPTSRLPVLRPAGSQGPRQTPSTEQLRKKPSLSSISRPAQQPPSLQKKPSLSSISRVSQPPPSLQKKPSLSTISSRPSQPTPTLQKKPSLSSIPSRANQPTSSLQKKPSLSSISRTSQPPPPSLQKKPSRTSLARSSIVSPTANTSSNRTSILSSRRSIPNLAQNRASIAGDTVFKRPTGLPPSQQSKFKSQVQKTAANGAHDDDVLGDLDAFQSASRASSRASSRAGFYENSPEPVLDYHVEAPQTGVRKSRPSLSERTIESLSQLPTSPVPGKTRRRSSFFSAGDSMGPPARPGSALSNGRRPTTSDGSSRTTPVTPRRSVTGSQLGSMTVPGKRSVSAATSSASATPLKQSSISRPMSTIKKPPQSQAQNVQPTPKSRPTSNTKTMIARTPKIRTSFAGTFGEALSPPDDGPVASPSSAMKTSETARKTANSSAAFREQLAKAKAAKRSEAATSPTATSPKPTSSLALRAQIAKAREAAKNNKAESPSRPRTNTPPRDAIIPDPAEIASFDFGLEEDPFNQRPKGGVSVLRKRIDAARADGRLNIAAMGLSEMPEEVLNMYEYDPNANTAWGEVVDLTTIIAADNELGDLPESMFPDVDYQAVMESDDDVPQFGGIQNLDVHGNLLRELPLGFKRLPQLSKLNISRNKLPTSALEIVFQISALRELKLAENELEGALPPTIEQLTSLETLELQGNKLTSLPVEIRALTHLRTLNISNNKMTNLPSEIFTSMSVIDLNASKNSFKNAFFEVDSAPHLQNLSLANNSLTSLCASETISLPSLKQLDVSTNRLSSLPNMETWRNIVTLLVGENSLSSIPEGFCSLQQLRNADFTANNIDRLDSRIALMEGLMNLTLAANPIRERKYLTMNAEDIKRDLTSRLDPESVPGAEISEEGLGFVGEDVSAEANGWKLTPSGTLDLSSQSMTEVDAEAMASFAQSHDIKQLYLQRNSLTQIPTITIQLTLLSVLDLSNNAIADPLSEELALPRLRELRLGGNKLRTLNGITTMLSAPSLHLLDVSNNRISGSLPTLREFYPELTTFLASDNNIDEVSDTSLAGLRIVNLSNNDIARLEPRIGLLSGTLTSFDVEGNKFRVPNYAVLKKGTDAVLSWLKDKVPSPTDEFLGPGSPGF